MRESYVEPHMAESLAGHVLEVHVDTPEVKGWYLKRPGSGRSMSTLILSTREGLVILGDLCPKRYGVISGYGYDWQWFAGKKSEGYLCEKFLSREFILEQAIPALREAIIEGRRSGAIGQDKAREALNRITLGDVEGPESCYEIFTDAGLSDIESLGHDYNPADAGWLCAIQQRFAQLMQAKLTEAA